MHIEVETKIMALGTDRLGKSTIVKMSFDAVVPLANQLATSTSKQIEPTSVRFA